MDANTQPTATAPAEEKVPAGQMPQYKLTERAYLKGDKLADEGTLFFFEGPPEHYMAPVNAAARAMVKKHGAKKYTDPLGVLPVAPQPQAIT